MARDGTASLEELVARYLPHLRTPAITVAGEGLDNIAYDIDDRYILRVSKQPPSPRRSLLVQRQADLLVKVREVSTLPTPRLVAADADEGVLVYATVPGVPLLVSAHHDRRLGAVLGRFLGVLHDVPQSTVEQLVDADLTPMSVWLDEARDGLATLRGLLPRSELSTVEAFVADDAPADGSELVFSHNDLGAEHILLDPSGAVSGIIDWGDAALADRAHDLAKLYRDLAPSTFDDVLAHYGHDIDPATEARIEFLARCGLLEDLVFGLSSGQDAYVRAALRTMRRLF